MDRGRALKLCIFLLILLCIDLFLSSQTLSQKNEDSTSTLVSRELTLIEAALYEEAREHVAQNQAIVFPITAGRVCCFTSFDPVPEKTFIYHKWFQRDKLSTAIKLSLQPPRWRTFSRIQLREGNKGPWRVEIADQEGNIFHILRFSITD